jgi:hypothetical protein
MRGPGEYQGGFYAIIEFIGLYVRYIVFKISQKNKTIKYLSGEEEYPKIDRKQRFYCLIIGLTAMLFLFSVIICFFITVIDLSDR